MPFKFIFLAVIGFASFTGFAAEDGEAIFKAKCLMCHSIGGGKKIGPDLKGVTSKKVKHGKKYKNHTAWIKALLTNPDDVLNDATDTYAQNLLKEYNNVRMINLGLKKEEIDALVAFLKTNKEVK